MPPGVYVRKLRPLRSEKPCGLCRVTKPLAEFYPDAYKRDGHHTVCKECVKADRKSRYAADPAKYLALNKTAYRKNRARYLDYARKLRRRVLDAYGNKCACCGETTPEFLGVDHVNNDGEQHRRELKGYGRSIYRWLAMNDFPQDGRFQLLCHNCNMAKGCYGGCPHNGPVPLRRHKDITSPQPDDPADRWASISSELAPAS